MFTTKMDTYWHTPEAHVQKLRSGTEVNSYFAVYSDNMPSTKVSNTGMLFKFGNPFASYLDNRFPAPGTEAARAGNMAMLLEEVVRHWPVLPGAAFRYTVPVSVSTTQLGTLRAVRKAATAKTMQRIAGWTRPQRCRERTSAQRLANAGKRQSIKPKRLTSHEEFAKFYDDEGPGSSRKRHKVLVHDRLGPLDVVVNNVPSARVEFAAAHPSDPAVPELMFNELELLELWYANGGRIQNEHADRGIYFLATILTDDYRNCSHAVNVERVLRWYRTKPHWLRKFGIEADGVSGIPNWRPLASDSEIESL